MDRIWSGILAFLLALAVVMPPKFLTVYVIAAGVMTAAYFIRFGQPRNVSPPVWIAVTLLGGAALFCALGTLPVTKMADIQLEFAKYAVYAAGFVSGIVLLRRPEQLRLFVTFAVMLIAVFFVLVAIGSGQRLVVNQSWPFYSPDQNNSTCILVPAAFLALFFPRALHRALLLLVVFFLVLMVESRLGVILTSLFILSNAAIRRDRWALALVVLAAGLWIKLDTGSSAPQAALIEATQNALSGVTSAADQAGIPVPVAPPPPETDMPAPHSVLGFGFLSDSFRFRIYARAIDIAGQTFPNLLGMGDARVVELLNSPQIYRNVNFMHAHNFFLQSYLAYGLLATLCILGLFVVLLTTAIRGRYWALAGTLLIVGGLGMIEALTSDIRVLTVLFILIGSLVAPITQREKSL